MDSVKPLEIYEKWKTRLVPEKAFGELLSKNWIDNIIPIFFLVVLIFLFSQLLTGFLGSANVLEMFRQSGELTFIAIGMAIVIMAGGIDLSVGSIFALANVATLALVGMLGWPLWLALPAVLLICACVGLLNGFLIGYLRLRAFLTTLATLIIVRALVDQLIFMYGAELAATYPSSKMWDFFAFGSVLGFPFNYLIVLVIAIGLHIMMTRLRLGWHIRAIGGSRRSAFNAGIPVKRVVCTTYVLSSVLTGMAGILYAARLYNPGSEAGVGMEVTALTAAVLGGNSLGGGRGSVPKAMLGAFIIAMLTYTLLRFGLPSGANALTIGVILLFAVGIDVRWLKNREKLLSRLYVSPIHFPLPDCGSIRPESGSNYALNNVLIEAEGIGIDQVDGAEDIAFDANDNIYTGSRHGDILRFFAPDYKKHEVFAHIGGHPLGMHFDNKGSLVVCVSGMGLYKVLPDRTIEKMTDETNRSWLSIIDDSRIRLADDFDFTPDGQIIFSEATIRFNLSDWATDAIEGRGNGRLIRYDPKTNTSKTILRNRVFPNGIVMTGDGESLLFAETWTCSIFRYWFDGPKKGKIETVIEDLPGYPDNIRRTSDGKFWVALVGMRTPALDLAMRMPGFRRRMTQRISFDEWLYPNLNRGCIVKFDLEGKALESYWNEDGTIHANVTSMREHKGYLYICAIYNNRIGRYRLKDVDPEFNDRDLYWEPKT